jgi:hypothetical protein
MLFWAKFWYEALRGITSTECLDKAVIDHSMATYKPIA